MKFNERQPKILVIDDEAINLKAIQLILEDHYELIFSTEGLETVELAKKHQPDLILLDVVMQHCNGFDICRQLKSQAETDHIPVIFVTVLNEMENEEEGFNAGAVDYISKPIKAPIVKARVKTHLSLVRAQELQQSQIEIVRRLGRAAEFKDDETSGHILRMSHYAEMLALAHGCSQSWANDLLAAAPMHDVGKIGIADAILSKPGKLDDEEWQKMTQHPAIGASIIGNHKNAMLQMARRLALEHHEKWDGSGYPQGLKGEQISLEARITAIADVFDALTSKRSYKDPWPHEKAMQYIKDQAGKHFDPTLAELFCNSEKNIQNIKNKWADK